MIVSTLDGYNYKWKINSVEREHKSDLHKNAAVLLKNIFKTSLICEEVQIMVKKNKYLYLDFFLPLYKLAIEIDGQQHTKYNNFFYKTPLNFFKQKINDNLKISWCNMNNITLIRLGYNEQPHEWRNKLISLGFKESDAGDD